MKLTKEFLKDIMSIPSCSKHEEMMRDYILDFAARRGIASMVDAKGNVYLTKGGLGPGEAYPCLVNHMDTVHAEQRDAVQNGRRLEILENRDVRGNTVLSAAGTGIGADDKLGCAIALAVLDDRDKCKAVFFVEEELGMAGSMEMLVEWFDDVSFVLSFDSPGRNRTSRSCCQRRLYSEEFFEGYLRDICSANGITNFNDEPYTDVVQVRDRTNIMCYNMGNGGYYPHRRDEYLVVEDAQATYKFANELFDAIGMRFEMRMPRYGVR